MFELNKCTTLGPIVAAAIMAAVPAYAVTIETMEHMGSYTIAEDTQFSGTMNLSLASGGPEAVYADFTLLSPGAGHAQIALTDLHVALFTDLTAEWLDASNSVLASIPVGTGLNTLSTTFDAAHLSQRLQISWSSIDPVPSDPNNSTLNPTLTITVTPVPLPASGLLLAGGIGAVSALRRRKSKTA